jgi:hypothetical protein
LTIQSSRKEFVLRQDYQSRDGSFGILQFAARPDTDDSALTDSLKEEDGRAKKKPR